MNTIEEIFEYVRANPVSAAHDVVLATPHIDAMTVRGSLTYLHNQGRLERIKAGRNWCYYVEDPLTAAESKKLTQLENLACELQEKGFFRRAATIWLQAFDSAKSHAARNRYARNRANCLSGMTSGVSDGAGSRWNETSDGGDL